MLSQMRRPSSLRKALAFLHGFLSSTVVARSSTTTSSILDCLRSQTPESLRDAYQRYRHHQGRPVSLATLGRHLYLIALLFHRVLGVCGAHTLTPNVLFGLPDPVGQQRRHRPRGGSVATTTTTTVDRFSVESLRPPTPSITPPSFAVRCPERGDEHTFKAHEVRALYLACDALFEKILMTSLFTTVRVGKPGKGFSCRPWHAHQCVL